MWNAEQIKTLRVSQIQDLLAARDSVPLRLLVLAAHDPKASQKVWTAAMGRLVEAYNAWQESIHGKSWSPYV